MTSITFHADIKRARIGYVITYSDHTGGGLATTAGSSWALTLTGATWRAAHGTARRCRTAARRKTTLRRLINGELETTS